MEMNIIDESDHWSRPRLQSLIDQYGITPTRQTIKQKLQESFHQLNYISILNFVINRFPIIRSMKQYQIKTSLFGDLIAGLTVAVMHIPQGIAYGVLANLSAVYGSIVLFCFVLFEKLSLF